MRNSVVVALHGAAYLLVSRVMAGRSVVELVAVVVVAHITVHVRVVVVDIYRPGMSVAGRIISPVPG